MRDYLNWSKLGSIEYSRAKLRDWKYGSKARLWLCCNPCWFRATQLVDISAKSNNPAFVYGTAPVGAWGFNAGSDAARVRWPHDYGANGYLTILAQVKRTGGATNQTVVCKGWTGQSYNFGMAIKSGALVFINSNKDYPLGAEAGIDTLASYAIVCDGGTTYGYLDGHLIGSTANGTTASPYAWLDVGDRPYSSVYLPFQGNIAFVAVLDGCLPESEIARLTADPFYPIAQSPKEYFYGAVSPVIVPLFDVVQEAI